MTSGLLSLPNELKFKICEQLFPILSHIHKFPSNVCNLDEDLESIFSAPKSRNVRALAMTCRELREFYEAFSFPIMRFDCDQEWVTMKMPESESFRGSENKIRFLSVVGRNSKRRHQGDCWMSVDRKMFKAYYKISTCMAFAKFTSVTTLHVEDFQFSHTNLRALRMLKALTTLSIHVPNFRHDDDVNIQYIARAFTFPKVRNLNLVVFDVREALSAGNVVKLFEKSIEMLAVKSNDYADMNQSDFLTAVLAGRKNPARLRVLKHLDIDFISYAPGRLQELVGNTNHLESMMVDCRGIPCFLPLFYVLDLLRLATGEVFDSRPMVHFANQEEVPDPAEEGEDADGDGDEEIEDEAEVEEIEFPYADKSSIWMAPLGRFSCKFRTVQVGKSQRRVVDTLKLYFAVEDEGVEILNKNTQLSQLRDVFHSRSTTFKKVQTLVVATERACPYEGDEPPEHLADTTESFAKYFPSAKRIIVRWWDFEIISWSASSRGTASASDDGLEVD